MPRLPRMRLPKIRIPNLLPLVLAAATLTVLSFFLYQYRQRSISLSVSWLTTQSELSQSRSHNENLQSRITELESEFKGVKIIRLPVIFEITLENALLPSLFIKGIFSIFPLNLEPKTISAFFTFLIKSFSSARKQTMIGIAVDANSIF